MNQILKIIVLTSLGGALGVLVWFIGFQMNQTPAIVGVDGPAILYMAVSACVGATIFGLTGVVLALKKKL